jgi:hypothetical protein
MISTVNFSYFHFVLLFFPGERNVGLGDQHDIHDNMFVLGIPLPACELAIIFSLNFA